MVLGIRHCFLCALLLALVAALHAQSAKQIVQQAVQAELAADQNDHSHWLYFEDDHEPAHNVKQWVAEAQSASVERVVELNGQKLPESQQQQQIESFVNDRRAQARQHKNGQHDDDQATELLKILPQAFLWTDQSAHGADTVLHFKPDPKFQPPDIEARVFAAMEGDMAVSKEQHRIVSLKGHLIRDVKFGFGILGELQAGGTFDVERRELAPNLWQITETHVHIQGHALIFKSIGEQQDDQKSKFRQIPPNTTLQQAETELLQQH